MNRLAFLALGLLGLSSAQDGPSRTDLFRTVRPQVSISIHRDTHGSAADLLDAISIDADYPPEQLQKQILALGASINSEPRGLTLRKHSVSGDDSRFTSIKATCAVDNLIDRKTGKFHLTEIVRAFAGSPEPHQVTGLSISFVGETPRTATLLSYGSDKSPVQVQGDYNPTFRTIEYRIKLNVQDPTKIEIPEGKEQTATIPTSSVASRGTDVFIYVLVGVAALAAGALVYSLLVRSSASKRS